MNTTDRNEIAAWLTSLGGLPPAGQDPTASPTLTPRADRIRERLSPLKDRLAAALEKIPAEVREDGLHMAEVWPLAIGRQRSKPAAHAVAAAMTSLGWQRRRFYKENEPSVTLWFPPAPATPANASKEMP